MKSPWYKKWWGILIIAFVGINLFGMFQRMIYGPPKPIVYTESQRDSMRIDSIKVAREKRK